MFEAQRDGVTVRMITPDPSSGVPISGFPFVIHSGINPAILKTPKRVTGNYLPATFEATGLPCKVPVQFILDRVSTGNSTGVAQIVSVTCSKGIDTKQNLRFSLLRTLALQASTFSATLYPPNYSFTEHGVTWKAGKTGDMLITGEGNIQAHTRDDKENTPKDLRDRYRLLADIWTNTEHGQRYEAARKQFPYGDKWIEKHVKRGKELYPNWFGISAGKKTKPTKHKMKGKTK